MRARVYLDWNATAPLRPEARAAMLRAMDTLGNPSSVHAEGRAARAIVEQARAEVAALAGAAPEEVVFTAGATEAAALALGGRAGVAASATAHDCVWAHGDPALAIPDGMTTARSGASVVAGSVANSETGVIAPFCDGRAPVFADAVQAVGRTAWRFDSSGADYAALSAHKIGGPAGVGALLVRDGAAVSGVLRGGGQEKGRRAGTENVVGLAGFGAAAAAARAECAAGVWERVEKFRIILENTLAEAAPDLIIVGRGAERLPNTSCFAVPGWRGETQVMQLDLAGFAVSAGSACSSGKVARPSRVLLAMGHDETVAASALRVSLGPTTTEAEIRAFTETWTELYRKRQARAA